MSKVTFYGSAAWVGAIHGPTTCEWWHSDPAQLNWDRKLLHMVDLAKTPSAAIAGHIKVSQIEVDDFAGSGGRTTIGPLWPGGTAIGAAWISSNIIGKAGAQGRPSIPVGSSGHDYEYMTVQYFDGEQQNRRFYGFQANLVQTQNHLSLVEIWNPGTGGGPAKPAAAWWLDLTACADPNTPPLAPNQPAALFLDTRTVQKLTMMEPKIPPLKGGFAFPVDLPGASG
jgi:hypothetical protein